MGSGAREAEGEPTKRLSGLVTNGASGCKELNSQMLG